MKKWILKVSVIGAMITIFNGVPLVLLAVQYSNEASVDSPVSNDPNPKEAALVIAKVVVTELAAILRSGL